jgi:hypothetical protein
VAELRWPGSLLLCFLRCCLFFVLLFVLFFVFFFFVLFLFFVFFGFCLFPEVPVEKPYAVVNSLWADAAEATGWSYRPPVGTPAEVIAEARAYWLDCDYSADCNLMWRVEEPPMYPCGDGVPF